jgi:hypothetical protein
LFVLIKTKTKKQKPHVAYHGTREENVRKIIDTGFLLDKLSTNTGNRGLLFSWFLFFFVFISLCWSVVLMGRACIAPRKLVTVWDTLAEARACLFVLF